MNPTNESIGRAIDTVMYNDDDLRTIVQDWDESDPIQKTAMDLALRLLNHREAARSRAGYPARELDREAPGEWVMVPREMTNEMADAFMNGSGFVREAWKDAITAAPGASLAEVELAEIIQDNTGCADSDSIYAAHVVLAAMLAAAPQPPAQEVSDYCAVAGCVHKTHGCPTWPADTNPFVQPPAQEQGEVISRLRFLFHRYWELAYAEGKEGRDTDTPGGDAQKTLTEFDSLLRTLTRAAGAEDARDAGAMMERWQSVWEDCNEIACNTGSDMIHQRAMHVLSYLDDHEPGKLERDAARYRFLRDVADNKDRVPFIAKRDSWCVSAWNGEAADASIDAAIASQAKGGGPMADKLYIGGVDEDHERCLRCGSMHLDTGWECTECGYDNRPHYCPPEILEKNNARD